MRNNFIQLKIFSHLDLEYFRNKMKSINLGLSSFTHIPLTYLCNRFDSRWQGFSTFQRYMSSRSLIIIVTEKGGWSPPYQPTSPYNRMSPCNRAKYKELAMLFTQQEGGSTGKWLCSSWARLRLFNSDGFTGTAARLLDWFWRVVNTSIKRYVSVSFLRAITNSLLSSLTCSH